MKVVLTGSSGFIGHHAVEALVGQGHDVMGVDRVGPKEPAERYRFTQCDIVDGGELMKIVTSFTPDAIVHLAARTDLEEKLDLAGYAANIEGVQNLVRAIRVTPSVRRAIFTSTQLVCRVGYRPKADDDYMASTLYGASKVEGEKIVRGEDGGGVAWCITRPTTVWGPGMSAHYQRFFRMIAAGRYVHVGKRSLYKSFGYVGNVVHQIDRLLFAPAEEVHRKTIYLADEPPLSLRDWADAIQREMGAPPIRTVPIGLARLLARAGDGVNGMGFRAFPFNSFRLNNLLTEYRFDLSETLRICGPTPYTMEQGVRELVRWFRNLDA